MTGDIELDAAVIRRVKEGRRMEMRILHFDKGDALLPIDLDGKAWAKWDAMVSSTLHTSHEDLKKRIEEAEAL